MTEDQIKAIAKDYAKENGGNIVFPIRIIAEEVLRWLTNDYCIVEREKVIEKYNEVKAINDVCDDLFADDRAVFHYLFGTSMFNQDEE